MDLPDEELQQPLVPAIDTQNTAPRAGFVPGNSRTSPSQGGKGPSPKRNVLKPTEPQRLAAGGPTGNHYVAMRANAIDGEEEEKQNVTEKRQLPYAAPNVHPYAVPQYEPNAYGGRGHGWGAGGSGGQESMFEQSRIPTIDIVFSGMYTFAAALTVIQGFGMLISFTLPDLILGFYTMVFGCIVVLFDLKSVVNGVSVEQFFPFLGNHMGRALTIAFFAGLCGQAHSYSGWTKLVVLYNLLVATLQGFVYFTTKTVTSTEHAHMEDLPDI